MAALLVGLLVVDTFTQVADDVWNAAPRQPLFAFLTGEAWNNMGSRRFFRDIQNFTCQQPVTCVFLKKKKNWFIFFMK